MNFRQVQEQHVPESAPFINTWLVAGPFDTAVAEEIYGIATLPAKPPSFAIDGCIKNQRVTENDKTTTNITPITPKVGQLLGNGTAAKSWEYFDDRIWNRNYDDYQDLYGYYSVKKGVDTKNKYVYAHTYVYSPITREIQFRFGSSGVHRLYVNDTVATEPSIPAEVQKDMVIQNIHLNQGWNKILLQIMHSYTADKNANGIEIAQDANVSYLGFYGRVTDAYGNKISNLEYSVTGDNTALSIDTQGLAADDAVTDINAKGRGLPANVLPMGYCEWPYVWNVSRYSTQHSIAASAYRFLASGGAPGYTWSVSEGALPAGLTLDGDGTIGGNCAEIGIYNFKVHVTDSENATAEKEFSIEVKERPNKWFEEGRVSALSHCIPIYNWFADMNYSADLWAQRAKEQGHSLVSVESLQQNYYWPSKFEDPAHQRSLYLPRDAQGKVLDGIKPFEEAVKRYGMKFGLYYATEGGGLQHFSTDVFVQNVQDLILRYEPAYLYFDGPQAMPSANYDVMYSSVRNFSDEIIINSNTNSGWGGEFGDADLRTVEASEIYSGANDNIYNKRTIMEPWKSVHTKNNYTPYYAKRDDFREVVREMIMNAGRGFVDNNDQMPLMSRGPNWDSPEDIAARYPKSVQEFIDVREGVAGWFAPEGKPERHESATGTVPYFLDGCGYTDDGIGNIGKFENGQGPAWGYAMSRDNNIYLHFIVGPDGKTGYTGNSITISPVNDNVTKVIWLNENRRLNFAQKDKSVTIELTGVTCDPLDTIIKIVTDNTQRKYKMTNLVLTCEQLTPSTLSVNVNGYMTYPALKVLFEQGNVTFASSNTNVAAVSANGVVSAVRQGSATITVTGTYENVTMSDTVNVIVYDNNIIRNNDVMIGVSMWAGDREAYGQFSSLTPIDYKLEGRSQKGGAIGLDAANISMKCGIVNLTSGTSQQPINITESDVFTFANGKMIPKPVSAVTRVAVWAEVNLDGQTATTNKVFIDLYPTRNFAKGATVTASSSNGSYTPEKVLDGILISNDGTDNSKWSASASGESWLAFDLHYKVPINNVEINFNSLAQKYYNTPAIINIQTSADGVNWSTTATVTPPQNGSTCYFGFSDIYQVGAVSRYVRLLFPQGSAESSIDILEVKINGGDSTYHAAVEPE